MGTVLKKHGSAAKDGDEKARHAIIEASAKLVALLTPNLVAGVARHCKPCEPETYSAQAFIDEMATQRKQFLHYFAARFPALLPLLDDRMLQLGRYLATIKPADKDKSAESADVRPAEVSSLRGAAPGGPR